MELTSPTPGSAIIRGDLMQLQRASGCAGCRWCDEAARAEASPCCGRPWGYEENDDYLGTCKNREEPAAEEVGQDE